MKVSIEHIANYYLDFEFNFSFIGKIEFHWHDSHNTNYCVVNAETKEEIKSGFKTFQEAEHWASEENFSIV